MLHEILLSLSGHSSPLLRNDHSGPAASALISPPERQLLDTAAHLSDLHCKLREKTHRISSSHPSAICRAVSTTVVSVHLAAFQRKIIEVEDSILRKDAALVGAYNIVPLTAVLGQFSGWTRRLEWLGELIEFMMAGAGREDQMPCEASKLIDRLRGELQTGYADVAETARSLLQVAETSWLKQVSAWVLYGRRPTVGTYDFFICEDKNEEHGYRINYDLLPSFVTPSTAGSMLFIGVSINRARTRAGTDLGVGSLDHLASQHQELAQLSSPFNGAMFSRVITNIRYTLSRTTLQKLLPLVRVLEILKVLREFFLIGRGEFAIALTQQADEKIRSRWRRADNLAYEKRDTLGTVVVKEGEVAAVLARTWAFLGSMQGQHADEDEALELARDLLRLHVSKSTETTTPAKGLDHSSNKFLEAIVTTSFQNFLFSVPVTLTLQIQSPLDLFLTQSDLQIYTTINSYLLSIRRAHLRLTDLWKITSLRRHHPPPPRAPYGNTKGGITKTRLLHERSSLRSSIMRSTWSTSSAAIFFFGETETYLQVEVVEGLWSHFYGWLTGTGESARVGEQQLFSSSFSTSGRTLPRQSTADGAMGKGMGMDIRPNHAASGPGSGSATEQEQKDDGDDDAHPNHDPQTLATAHRQYLAALTRRLLLTQPAFTTPLYDLLIQIDQLVALVHRLNTVWVAADLEADEGVVDAFANLDAEERDVRAQLRGVERRVKFGIENVIAALRTLSLDSAFAAEMEGEEGDLELDEEMGGDGDEDGDGGRRYRPRRIGGIDRLLMKLDFGGWFGDPAGDGSGGDVLA
ncbi:Spc97/Spc98 family protein [Nemania sp. FL0031]|nr:Spc97/Spc98 family protein [Nemania sp. FL0031]